MYWFAVGLSISRVNRPFVPFYSAVTVCYLPLFCYVLVFVLVIYRSSSMVIATFVCYFVSVLRMTSSTTIVPTLSCLVLLWIFVYRFISLIHMEFSDCM